MRTGLVSCVLVLLASAAAGQQDCQPLQGTSGYSACVNDQLRQLGRETQALQQEARDRAVGRAIPDADPYQTPPVYPVQPEVPPVPVFDPAYAASQRAARQRQEQDSAFRTRQLGNSVSDAATAHRDRMLSIGAQPFK